MMNPKGVVAGVWLDTMSVAVKVHTTLPEKDQDEGNESPIKLIGRQMKSVVM